MQSRYILSDFSLVVRYKERIIVTGPIGSGKSTLIKLLLRLAYPEKGSMMLDDRCIYDYNVKSYFNKVGFMPQNCLLFNRSIIDNILYDNKDVNETDVLRTMREYDMTHRLPNIRNDASDLSGGQRQLVWFLRIYFKNPDLIILDEPTASLDDETKGVFLKMIDSMLKNKTLIIITHDKSVYDFGTRVVYM